MFKNFNKSKLRHNWRTIWKELAYIYLLCILWACLIFGCIYAVNEGYKIIHEVSLANTKVQEARKERDELLEVLSGRLAMVSPLGREFDEVAEVHWHLVSKDVPISTEKGEKK